MGKDDLMDTLMPQLLRAVGQFESSLIAEWPLEGMALAKAEGVGKGRKPALNAEAATARRKMAA